MGQCTARTAPMAPTATQSSASSSSYAATTSRPGSEASARRSAGDADAAVSKLFAAFDRSKDGFISRDELVEHFSKLAAPDALLRQLNAPTVEAATEALLQRVDTDGDGRIRFRCAPLPVSPLSRGRLRFAVSRARARATLSVTQPRSPLSSLALRAHAASKSSRTTSRFFPPSTSCARPTSWG